MAKLIVPTIYYKSGFKYVLAQTVVHVHVPELAGFEFDSRFLHLSDGWMVFQIGYPWDGLSGPMVDTPSAMPAGLVHDGGAEILRNSPDWSQEKRREFFNANNVVFHRLLTDVVAQLHQERQDTERRWWHPRRYLQAADQQWNRFRAWYASSAVDLARGYASIEARKPIHRAP